MQQAVTAWGDELAFAKDLACQAGAILMERYERLEQIDARLDAIVKLAERLQDALVTAELDPGLFHRHANPPKRRELGIDQFVDLLRRAIGSSSP